jgi:hypothetical protein
MGHVGNLTAFQEAYIVKCADDLAKEIDFDVMVAVLVDQGWHLVELPRFVSGRHAVDIAEWAEQYYHGKFQSHGRKYLFCEPADATMFALRWA